MGTLFTISLVGLMIAAPWISRRWGKYGEITWGVTSMLVLILAIEVLQ